MADPEAPQPGPSDPGWRKLDAVLACIMERKSVGQEQAETDVIDHLRRRLLSLIKFPPHTVDFGAFERLIHHLAPQDVDFAESKMHVPLITPGPRGWNEQLRGWVPIEVHITSVDRAWPPLKGKGGRPPAAQWAAIEDALRIKVQADGLPDEENPTGWQRQADVERWVADLLADRGETATESTVRLNVKAMLQRIAGEAGN